MRSIQAIRAGALAALVALMVAASRVPDAGRPEFVVVLCAAALIAALGLGLTSPRLVPRLPLTRAMKATLLTERRVAIRDGTEMPATRSEFADAWQDWCDDLTAALRLHGKGHEAKVLRTYYTKLRKRALVLFDEARGRGLEDGLVRSDFYRPQSAEELWVLNDRVFAVLIRPHGGPHLTVDRRK